jgi:hypothetical protein
MRPRATVALLAFAGYFVIARGVHDLYPFSTFSMYSGAHPASASRIIAIDEGGTPRELERYGELRCAEPIDLSRDRCGPEPFYNVPYLDRDAEAYVRSHLAGAEGSHEAEKVLIVRRIWRFPEEGGAPRVQDCDLVSCTGARR